MEIALHLTRELDVVVYYIETKVKTEIRFALCHRAQGM